MIEGGFTVKKCPENCDKNCDKNCDTFKTKVSQKCQKCHKSVIFAQNRPKSSPQNLHKISTIRIL